MYAWWWWRGRLANEARRWAGVPPLAEDDDAAARADAAAPRNLERERVANLDSLVGALRGRFQRAKHDLDEHAGGAPRAWRSARGLEVLFGRERADYPILKTGRANAKRARTSVRSRLMVTVARSA